jgi:Family of unknown function (DUF6069)
MSTTKTAGRTGLGTTARNRSPLLAMTAGAVVATLVNSALWAGGRAADVSFGVESDYMTEVGILPVVLTTLVMFAVGAGLFVLAARRSRRWVRAVLVTAAVVAVVSVPAPLAAAHDAAAGVLLASMHLATGAIFLVTAWRAGAR